MKVSHNLRKSSNLRKMLACFGTGRNVTSSMFRSIIRWTRRRRTSRVIAFGSPTAVRMNKFECLVGWREWDNIFRKFRKFIDFQAQLLPACLFNIIVPNILYSRPINRPINNVVFYMISNILGPNMLWREVYKGLKYCFCILLQYLPQIAEFPQIMRNLRIYRILHHT